MSVIKVRLLLVVLLSFEVNYFIEIQKDMNAQEQTIAAGVTEKSLWKVLLESRMQIIFMLKLLNLKGKSKIILSNHRNHGIQ